LECCADKRVERARWVLLVIIVLGVLAVGMFQGAQGPGTEVFVPPVEASR
jgi:hypothetical protein